MERLLDIGLIIGIPFIILCIMYAIYHGLFMCVNYDKKLPDIKTLNDKYRKVNIKRKQKAWLKIRSDIVYAAKHGRKHVSIVADDYIDIPYDEFKGELENHGYVLEAHSKMWYRERFSIDVSWEEDSAGIPICIELEEKWGN